tara:strand:- start:434 stop:1195 length:762 start_codon:yes stop_codon:yes gene_type:complete
MKVRRFNDEGRQKYTLLYNQIKVSIINSKSIEKGYTPSLKSQIKALLSDNKLSEEIGISKEIEFKKFENSFEFGVYLNSILEEKSFSSIAYDAHLWDWLSLFFFDIVFHPKARGYSEHRYILSDDWFTRNRHLVRTPWYITNVYGKFGKLFLAKETYTGTDYLEQFISHRISENYTKLGEICFKLYFDQKTKEPKPGYSKKFIKRKNKKTLVKASLGRLVDKLNQYNEIYNIWEMGVVDIINLLPKEFDELKV